MVMDRFCLFLLSPHQCNAQTCTAIGRKVNILDRGALKLIRARKTQAGGEGGEGEVEKLKTQCQEK